MLSLIRSLTVFAAGLFATAYLLNPTLGVFELLPDNMPLLGNLDEAAAATLLLMCLSYFGIDLTRAFRRRRVDSRETSQDTQ
ncbi:MAG: hypothetical protein AAF823_03470 [Planctomycetota bacterium]